MHALGAWIASTLARVGLWLYPPSFRREMGDQIVSDVRRHAREFRGILAPLSTAAWLVRLSGSLVVNGIAAWREARVASKGGSFSWLDVKLGLRMLVKSPGITLAGGLGIAVAIAVAGGFFTFGRSTLYPSIPLPEGDRLVGLENWDLSTHNENRRSLHDYYIWKDEMQSVEDMSAFTDVYENLVGADGSAEQIRVAEMTPAGFALAQVPPYMGRTLVDADMDPDAAPVIVIGYDVWRTRFASDPHVLGTGLRVGDTPYEVVGVMPEGFAFPVEHSYWVPLEARPEDFPVGEGPSVFISGRLAPGYDLRDAQAELAVIGARMAAEYPETHGSFKAQAMKYVYPLVDMNHAAGADVFGLVAGLSAILALVLIVVCLNVAVLVYARAAMRRGEIAVRQALGASRLRIVGQMFIEVLILCGLAAVVGVVLLKVGLTQAELLMETEMGRPFWSHFGLTVPGLAYVVLLTLLAAVVTGVLPGLQATGRNVQDGLTRFGSKSGPGLGRTWTALIVVQIAVAVVALPLATSMAWWEVRGVTTSLAFDADPFVRFAIADPDQRMQAELDRRLDADPDVLAHGTVYGFPSGARGRIGVLGPTEAGDVWQGLDVRTTLAGPGFLEMVGATTDAGRPFRTADWDEGAPHVALVNRGLADRYLGGNAAVGKRFRYANEEGTFEDADDDEWIEVIGVVENLLVNRFDAELVGPAIYRPLPPDLDLAAINGLIETTGGDPTAIISRLRESVAQLDPTLQTQIIPLASAFREQQFALRLAGLALGLSILAVILLSSAGIYAMTSFTVSRRQREIGIRTALGAHPTLLLRGIFGRALRQIVGGVAVGVAAALGLDRLADGELLHGLASPLLTAMVLLMAVVGLMAAAGPARRGLRIEPTEALKGE